MLTAKIFANLPVKNLIKAYTYRIPAEFAFIGAGWRVIVPFGGRRVEGFVLATQEITAAGTELKDIIKPLGHAAWFPSVVIEAAHKLADFYLCPPAQIMRLFIPGKGGMKKEVAAKLEEFVVVADNVTIDEKLFSAFARKKAQLRLLQYLRQTPRAGVTQLKKDGFSAAVIKAVEAAGIIRRESSRRFRDSYGTAAKTAVQTPELTAEQKNALSQIEPNIVSKKYGGFLLHGVTGSGKTLVYIEAAAKARSLGRLVIVLVPEIALTGQLVENFKQRFDEDIIVIHSRLSIAERNDAIERARCGAAGIIIGARSALFSPVDNIGLIILDEEQDNSYKQDETPRYHARVVAEVLARLHGATLVLGSATPALETYARAKRGSLTYLAMPQRVGGRALAQVLAVDMRAELHLGNRNILSRALLKLLADTLAAGEQSIIMLNRRGWSTFVMCRSCGEVIKCPECNLPMVYHHSDGRLKCHHCDIAFAPPKICPKCQSRYIKYFGSGTEKLESELAALLPSARIIRMDRDTTARKFAHGEILNKFKRGECDILLGTQMVAKGHDIEGVTAVGVISADAGLNMPDFRAAERTFMLITQTAGRAGRGQKRGKVIVQSYNPDHYAVLTALRQDYEAFFAEEIKRRKDLFYPPYCRLIKLIFQNENEQVCRQQAEKLAENFRTVYSSDSHKIIGPFSPAIKKFRNIHRVALLIKTADLTRVRNFLRQEGAHTDSNVIIDIDPINMF